MQNYQDDDEDDNGAFKQNKECAICFSELEGNPFICRACATMSCRDCTEMLRGKGQNNCVYCWAPDTLTEVYTEIGKTKCFNCGFDGSDCYFDCDKKLLDSCQMCGIAVRQKPIGWEFEKQVLKENRNKYPNQGTMKYLPKAEEQKEKMQF